MRNLLLDEAGVEYRRHRGANISVYLGLSKGVADCVERLDRGAAMWRCGLLSDG
jgi:hypothetical protein